MRQGDDMRISKIFFFFLLGLVLFFSHNIIVLAETSVEELGNKFGYYDGLLEGYRYIDVDQAPNPRDLLDIQDIEEKYEYYLKDHSTAYRASFISAYYTGFQEGYNEIINTGSNPDDNDIDYVNKYTHYADILGLLMGEIYGFRDYYLNNNANPDKAIPSSDTINKIFNLNRLNSNDRHLFMNTFKSKFKEGYEGGYAKASFEPMRTSLDEGLYHGEYFGKILGGAHGARDYLEGKTRNYKRDIPSDQNIIKDFYLNDDGNEYRQGFLIGFRRAYEESYNENYRTMNVEIHRGAFERGYEHGKISGKVKGELKAYEDFHLQLENDWSKHYPSQGSLLKEYGLNSESIRYREGFFSGFLAGLAEGYGNKYQELREKTLNIKTKLEELPLFGGEVNSLDGGLLLRVDKGTFYNPIVITIDTLPDGYFPLEKDYIKASNFYKINIINKSNEVDKKKDIELRFEYYGKDNGGVYKLSNGQWIYLPSYVGDGYIKTYVKPNSLKKEKNVFAVFIDKNYNVIHDIRKHWAKEEIIAFQRRGLVSGYTDNSFKPEKEISRYEFLSLLSRVYQWEIEGENSDIKFSHLLKYAKEKAYIETWEDDLSKASAGISYREVESIMRKILEDDNFHWYNVSAKILYEKNHRSKYYNSPDNFITRSEAVYMLYILNEWRY